MMKDYGIRKNCIGTIQIWKQSVEIFQHSFGSSDHFNVLFQNEGPSSPKPPHSKGPSSPNPPHPQFASTALMGQNSELTPLQKNLTYLLRAKDLLGMEEGLLCLSCLPKASPP